MASCVVRPTTCECKDRCARGGIVQMDDPADDREPPALDGYPSVRADCAGNERKAGRMTTRRRWLGAAGLGVAFAAVLAVPGVAFGVTTPSAPQSPAGTAGPRLAEVVM